MDTNAKNLRALPRESQVVLYTDMYLGLLGAEDHSDEKQIRDYESTLSYLRSVLTLSAADILVIEARTVALRTQVMQEVEHILKELEPPVQLN